MRILLASCLMASIMNGALAAQGQPRPIGMVKAEDLCEGKCEIVGLLGKPYGAISKIRGVWEGWEYGWWKVPPGEKQFSLRVTEIDGETLPPEKQIVIHFKYVKWLRDRTLATKPVRGEQVEGRVYESGGYVRHPGEVLDILGEKPRQDFFDFRFYSFLHFVDYSSIKKPERN